MTTTVHLGACIEVMRTMPDAFAQAVGGETIDEQAGFVAQCCICTADDAEMDEEW